MYRLTTKDAPDGSQFMTVIFHKCADATSVRRCYQELAGLLKMGHRAVAQERIFGRLHFLEEMVAIRSEVWSAKVAASFFEGVPASGGDMAGILIRAVPEKTSTLIVHRGKVVGMEWCCEKKSFAILGAVQGTGNSPAEETATLLKRTQKIIANAGYTVGDIVRTWFYLDNILNWYDDFNRVRTEVYSAWNLVSDGSASLRLPASTGIGVRNGSNSAVTADVLLAKGTQGTVSQLSNPGQKDAFQYGSAFSRGALLSLETGAIMELSGTASIDESGATVFVDDADAQILCTVNKIEALLKPQQLSVANMASGVAFFRNPNDVKLLDAQLKRNNLTLQELPLVCVQADICRDDLLFEMDGELV